MAETVNKPNPHRDRLIKEYPQRPLYMVAPGYPVSTALREEQVLADTTGLVRYVAWVDDDDQSHLVTLTPDPSKRALYRGRLD